MRHFRLLLLLIVILPLAPAFGHSGEWNAPAPPAPFPPNPLPKWPGPITMQKPTDPNPEPTGLPGRRVDRGGAKSGWSSWWYLHRERILDTEAIARRRAGTDADGKPDRAAILPALRNCMASGNDDLRTSAIIALGRARDVDSIPRLVALVTAKDSSPGIVESSLLALGLIGQANAEVAKLMADIVTDAAWSQEVRSFAALALGLSGRDTARAALLTRLDRKREPDKRVRAAVAAALGILGRDEAADDLARALVGPGGRETDPGTRAYAAAALGALATGAGRTALMQTLKDLDLGVARQAALSLGVHSDPWARAALVKAFDTERDSLTRSFIALALADAGEKKMGEPLREAGRKGDSVLAPHALVALGLLSRRTQDGKAAAALILMAQSELGGLLPDDRAGALVIATALAGGEALSSRFAAICRSTAGEELKGHAAVAIGILGGDDAVLVEMVTAGTPPPLLREVGVAGALLGSRVVQAKLRALLAGKAPESARCVAAVSLGLYRTDGKATTAALSAVLGDRKQPPLVRACAAVALGRRLEAESPSRLALASLRLTPGLAAGPFREVLSMR